MAKGTGTAELSGQHPEFGGVDPGRDSDQASAGGLNQGQVAAPGKVATRPQTQDPAPLRKDIDTVGTAEKCAAWAARSPGLVRWWPLGVVLTVIGLTTWLALSPVTASPLPALAALADTVIPAALQPYRAELPHLLGFAGLVVLFTALLGRAGVAVVLVLGFATLLEVIQLFLPWREASWVVLRVNLLAVALGLVLVGLGVTLGRWARRGIAALGKMATLSPMGLAGRNARGRQLAAGEGPRVAAVKQGCAGAAPWQRRPQVKQIIAEFERSFGWRGVRVRISLAPVAPAEVTLWVPEVPSPAMALLARAIETEWAAAGQSLHIRLVAAAEGEHPVDRCARQTWADDQVPRQNGPGG